MGLSADLKTRVVLELSTWCSWPESPTTSSIIRIAVRNTPVAFSNRCKEAGVRPSTGSVGDAYDNAMCESFFAATRPCVIFRPSNTKGNMMA
jgi:putative transposase